jgi:hypothetical protein
MDIEAKAKAAEMQRIKPTAGEARTTESGFNARLPLDRAGTTAIHSIVTHRPAGRQGLKS